MCWVVWRAGPQALWAAASSIRPGWLALAALAPVCSLAAGVARWRFAVLAVHGAAPPWRTLARGAMLAAAVNSVTPAKAGDLLKAAALRPGLDGVAALASVLLERTLDLLLLALLALACGMFTGDDGMLAASAALLTALLLAVFAAMRLPLGLMVRFPGVASKLAGLRGALAAAARAPAALAAAAFFSLAALLLAQACVVSLCQGLGQHPGFWRVLGAWVLAALAGIMPVSVSGVGVRDAAFAVLLGRYMPQDQAAAVAVCYTLLAYWLPAALGLPVLALGRGRAH